MKCVMFLLIGLLGCIANAMAQAPAQSSQNTSSQAPAQPSQNPAGNATPTVSEEEYAQIPKRIFERVMTLKESQPTLKDMKSPAHHEYNVTWVLDDPTQPHGKRNARRAVFDKGGYWFSLQFYRGDWKGAAMFVAVEFGDLKLWFNYGHGGEASVIGAVHAIIKEENEAFRKRHPS